MLGAPCQSRYVKGHGASKKASIPFSFIWMASDSHFLPCHRSIQRAKKPDQKRAFLVPPSIRKRFYNKCWGEEIFFPHPIFA